MKIAIHHRKGSFSDRWITYCQEENIDYIIVNCYESDIIEQLKGCDALMWHHHHADFKDVLTAKRILFALEHAGIKVFPNFNTGWHFDDKVAQKYLLEAIGASLVPSYVFYDKQEALDWAESTTYPKVWKLKGGAGAANVKLVRSKREALKLINKAFGKGFSQFNRLGNLKERYKKFKAGKDTLVGVAKGLGRLVVPTEFAKLQSRERGYIYFQKFIPGNLTDTRVVVVGNKIIGERRGVRKGDFRASGSDILLPDVSLVDMKCVQNAWEVSKRLNIQMGVFDYIHDEFGNPLIVEISYGTSPDYTECEGYWDEELVFHQSEIDLPQIIIEHFLSLF